jgi:hypothetical protein
MAASGTDLMKVSEAKDIVDEDASHVDSDDGTMAELRSLLLGPAEKQLAEVHERLHDPQRQVEEVSRVLPDAIAVRTRQDEDLTSALAPTVSAALEYSVRKNPQPLADAIFPIMGPAIRKAIASALSGMAQTFNQTLAHSMSARGLAWRWEAVRTGRPFSEVVLLHTLLFRVEQVFLIHQETGLLLRHVSAANADVQDADMVSGMLTAIQDFVRDSFATRAGEKLETLQVGELNVWIEQGPDAILAGVIRGNAPQQLREVFQETLEKIHLQEDPSSVWCGAQELFGRCCSFGRHAAVARRLLTVRIRSGKAKGKRRPQAYTSKGGPGNSFSRAGSLGFLLGARAAAMGCLRRETSN